MFLFHWLCFKRAMGQITSETSWKEPCACCYNGTDRTDVLCLRKGLIIISSKLVRDLLFQLDAYNSMDPDEILPRIVKEFVWWEISQDLSLFFFFFFFPSFGILGSILLISAFHTEVWKVSYNSILNSSFVKWIDIVL